MATKKQAKTVYCNGYSHQFPISELLRERGDGTLPPEIRCQCGKMVELHTYGEDGRLATSVRMSVQDYQKSVGAP